MTGMSDAAASYPGGRDGERSARRISRVLPRSANWEPLPVGALPDEEPGQKRFGARSLHDIAPAAGSAGLAPTEPVGVTAAVMAEATAVALAAAHRPRRLRPSDLFDPGARRENGGADPATVDRRSQSVRDAEREAEFARTIELIDRDWQMRVDMARADGIREGVRLAAEQHAARMDEQAQQMRMRGQALLSALDTELQGLKSEVADRLMDIAIHFGARIACREIAIDRDRLVPVLSQMIALVDDDFRSIELTVHPDDIDVAREWVEPRSAGRTVTLRPDPSLLAGGCVARIDEHCIDARIGVRMAHALGSMGWTPDEAQRDVEAITAQAGNESLGEAP